MILDSIENSARYATLHPGFRPAFDYLRQLKFTELPPGRNEIDGSRLYVMLLSEPGRGRQTARLESHRRYIDIQFVVQGTDLIGWRPLGSCFQVDAEYDPERDVGFFREAPDSWIAVPARQFAVFYPEDAHAPLAGEGPLQKAVIKIAVDW